MSFLGVGLSLLGTLGETASDSVVTSILDSAGISVGAAGRAAMGAALSYIHSGVQSGMSANQIGQILSDAGLGVRRQNLLGVVRALRTTYGYPSYVPGSAAAEYPDASVFRFAFGQYKRKYNVIVTVQLRDPLTGETTEQSITLSGDRLLTLDEIDNMVLAYGPSLEGSPKLAGENEGFDQTTGYTVDNVFVAP